MRDNDLVVASDGINSRIRETFADHFRPQTDLRPNRFVWMGSTKPLDAFTFMFKETPEGVVILHAYQYEAGRSTWIFELDPETFARMGFGGMDEAQSAARLEALFAEELDGHKLIVRCGGASP
jgi:anthraniloyl-CoA monooxygenase